MKYYYIYSIKNYKSYDEFLEGTTDDISEACQLARDIWDRLTKAEKKYNEIEIRHYLYDIEDEDCSCFDYDLAPEAWYWWYAVTTDEEDCDHGYGSFDWYEAYGMASEMYERYPHTQIVTVDYRDDFCVDVESFKEIKKNMEMAY